MTSTAIPQQTKIYSRAQGIAIAALGSVLMSLDPIFIRFSGVSSVDTAFLFGLFTAISMSILIQVTDKRGLLRVLIEGGWPLIFVGILMVGSASGLVFSIKHTSVANSLVIISSTPAVAALFSWIFLGEKTNRKTMMAIAAVIVGIVVVVSGSVSGHGGMGAGHWVGDLAAMGSVVCLSGMFVVLRKYKDVSRMANVAVGAFFLAIVMSFFAEPSTYSVNTWLVMAAMGMFSAPMGRVLTKVATRYASAAEVTMTLMLETVLAPIWAYLFFTEVPAMTSFVGGGLIFITIVIYTLDAFKSEK